MCDRWQLAEHQPYNPALAIPRESRNTTFITKEKRHS